MLVNHADQLHFGLDRGGRGRGHRRLAGVIAAGTEGVSLVPPASRAVSASVVSASGGGGSGEVVVGHDVRLVDLGDHLPRFGHC